MLVLLEKYFDGVCFSSSEQPSGGVLEKISLKDFRDFSLKIFPLNFAKFLITLVLEICERLLLSCYFNNFKIFCFNTLEFYQ